ncbi:(2Fe-2S)-binding protein [Virgibacillus alimentarius]|uniref:Sarcosine oxidase subunit alpha n=1 Tax=Virgibacillus alimentarius TaxID=698769 RepID=A0ABS4S9A8_9BACI|nr:MULTISPECIES: (2Fe-2S)-binding protein [Virgibacillus]MBP2258075.1 sarcosine oxidase subunit alpha [Virgibacillus alimentarius]HLR67085.1 (2Fe-2S)-binding protein [Virgibacillus sp.]
MTDRRILDHPILGGQKSQKEISFTFNQKEYKGLQGEPIAAALLANGVRTLRYHEESGTPRGIYCNIGHCFECRVIINGKQGQRACLTPLEEGMVIESPAPLPTPVRDWRYENA